MLLAVVLIILGLLLIPIGTLATLFGVACAVDEFWPGAIVGLLVAVVTLGAGGTLVVYNLGQLFIHIVNAITGI